MTKERGHNPVDDAQPIKPSTIGGGMLYLILVVTLGVMTIRKGHWIMFIIGIFLPFFWLIGALMPARGPAY